MKVIKLNSKQKDYVTSEDKFTLFIGGLGCGKTFSDALLVLNYSKIPKSFGLLTAPLMNQLKYITNSLVSIWADLGIHLNQDYVINQKPPKHWGVEPYSILNNQGIITTKWGSYIQVKEAFNPDIFRASEFDWIVGDEARDFKSGVVDVLIGRLRGRAYKELGMKHQIKLSSTVFDNISEIQRYKDMGANVIESKTADNIHNLPIGYIEFQKQLLDDRTYRREVLGEVIPQTQTIFYNYSDDNLSDLEFDVNKDCVLSFDFNVNPMTCLVFQDNVAVKEFQFTDSNTDDTTFKIVQWLKSLNYQRQVIVTGDPSGQNRSTQSAKNNYQIIKENFNEFDVLIQLPVREGIAYGNNCISSAIRTAIGTIKLRINKKECPHLHNNINIVTYKDYEKGDPNNVTHNIDALRYYCVRFLPIRRAEVHLI